MMTKVELEPWVFRAALQKTTHEGASTTFRKQLLISEEGDDDTQYQLQSVLAGLGFHCLWWPNNDFS